MPEEVNIKQLIKDYIQVDDQVSELNKELKDLRKGRTAAEDKIKDYMLDNNIEKVNMGVGTLKISKNKANKKLNRKIIQEILLDSLEEEKADKIMDDLFNNEDADEITKLERSKKRN